MNALSRLRSLRFNSFRALILAGSLVAVSPLMLSAAEPKVAESLSMEIIALPLDHQGPQVIDLSVKISYVEGIEQKDYPDFEVIHREIKEFLATYPNEKDYIEIVNKKLCRELLKRYLSLTAVSIDIRLYPTMTIPYAQVSHCIASR